MQTEEKQKKSPPKVNELLQTAKLTFECISNTEYTNLLQFAAQSANVIRYTLYIKMPKFYKIDHILSSEQVRKCLNVD